MDLSNVDNESYKKYSGLVSDGVESIEPGINLRNPGSKITSTLYENETKDIKHESTLLLQEELLAAHHLQKAFKHFEFENEPQSHFTNKSTENKENEAGKPKSKVEEEINKYKMWPLGIPFNEGIATANEGDAESRTGAPEALPKPLQKGMTVLRGSSNPFGNIYAPTTPLGIYPVIEIFRGTKKLRNLRKKTLVLSGFNMNVYSNKLYCLVGPRKCGKTTVCKIVIGRWGLDGGVIRLFGKSYDRCNPSDIGYMPEENKLQLQFTIKETFFYFGNLFKIPRRVVEDRLSQYSTLFELPGSGKKLKKMRDQEIRAVSFALALLHQPRLLILDEPTAGVDPVLRHMIWQHLHVLLRQGSISVLVTSHDMAEAPFCDSVGIMHKGFMLAEGAPQDVVRHFGAVHLRDIAYLYETGAIDLEKLRSMNKTERDASEAGPSMKPSVSVGFMPVSEAQTNVPEPDSDFDKNRTFLQLWCPFRSQFMTRSVWRITCRSISSISRNFCRLLLILFLPPLFLIIFGLTVGLIPGNLHVAVVNYEGNCSKMKNDFRNIMLSCNMLRYLKQDHAVQPIYYDDMANAEIAFRLDRIKAILVFVPKLPTVSDDSFETEPTTQSTTEIKIEDMTKAPPMTRPVYYPEANIGYNVGNSSLVSDPLFSNPDIVLMVDNSNILVRNVIVDSVTNAQRHVLSDFSAIRGQKLPIVVLKSVHERSYKYRPRGMLVWGGVVGYCFAAGAIISAATVADDDDLDVNDRLIAAGFFIYSLVQDKITAVKVVLYILCPLLLLSGILWPVNCLSPWLRKIVMFGPINLAAEAITVILVRWQGIFTCADFPGDSIAK
ncbi:uncharacterized protein LOC113373454 [Ctenocephalides felis]|uniref:uncharacterized protein LOC113373454 n=1 Tax=Ctenocephalides felis TaxID=7515 RepID=UPI000E6E4F02|nr:uncharacterized protein LOC113373454 [Ctenocephalides felis]